MKKNSEIQPYIISFLELGNLYNSIIRDVELKADLKSKYLYLGWHGAKAWKNVDSSYKISAEGLQLINDHFGKIDEIVRSSTKHGRYNIVSLGTGTGEEDSKILDVLIRKFPAPQEIPFFNIFLLDIAIELLNEGTNRIKQKINNNARLRQAVLALLAINVDIEKLHDAKEVLSNYKPRKSNTNLYHLLGLTLGNNFEYDMLNSIYRAMNVEDYLLLSVDFCADDEAQLKRTMEQYHSKEITDTINEYLCSPLFFSFRYYKDDKNQHIKLGIDEFEDLEILFDEDRRLSNIPDSISFVYNYKFKEKNGSEVMRACFSTKYRSLSFKNYIERYLPKREIFFEIVEDIRAFGDERTGQYLVLLKKTSKTKEVGAVVTIREADRKNAIGFVNKLLFKTRDTQVQTPGDLEFIKIYNEIVNFLESSQSDSAKIKLIITEVIAQEKQSNLKNLAVAYNILSLIR